MSSKKGKVRAIDLYSGIGGWSLGLEMAGINVVASYEWWNKANRTNQANNQHHTIELDIRELPLDSLPQDIDIVVGSPPCTQFSFANRGGSGDIEDGLKDIAKFLSVIDFIRPKFWAMENVPRVAGILERELQVGGRLEQFAHLKPTISIVDTCEWGVPQRRRRCIAGNFDFGLLQSYKEHTTQRTLGDVIRSLSSPTATDPIYGIQLPNDELKDHIVEEFLSAEEERMNREMKTFHPVYNNMAFPDPLNRSARTITATCTRVSRESVVIAAPEHKGRFRRLTVRERGCLQGFPITYQFYGDSYSQKLKMIGNAVPPAFTFYIGQAMLGIPPEKLLKPSEGIKAFSAPQVNPPRTLPDTAGATYPATRRFRAAIPHLRFKSGVRFELANSFVDEIPIWNVKFFFGNSKNILEIELDKAVLDGLKKEKGLQNVMPTVMSSLSHIERIISSTNAATLQSVWTHTAEHRFHPYEVVDVIGNAAEELISMFISSQSNTVGVVEKILTKLGSPIGMDKILKNSNAVLAGLFVGSAANVQFRTKNFNQSRS